MNTAQLRKSVHVGKLPEYVQLAECMRRDPENPQDVTLSEVLEELEEPLTLEDLMEDLGIDPQVDTLNNLFTAAQANVRWLIPEIIRDSIRLGLRKAPIYPNIIAAEETIKGLTAVIPAWNMSDAKPKVTGEGETIQLGSVSYGSKTIKVRKLSRGISVSYEVKNYVSVDVVKLFLEDFGVKLGMGLDTLAIDTLINGDQPGGTDAISVVGVGTTNTLAYKDLLRVWVRLARLGKSPNTIISGEAMALDTLDLPEFKNPVSGSPVANLTFKTPIPRNTNYYVHSQVPSNQSLILDPNSALIKYTAQPLLVESEKIMSNQTEATYASLTAGFGTIMKDSRIMIDRSVNISGNNFPAFMDPSTQELVVFD